MYYTTSNKHIDLHDDTDIEQAELTQEEGKASRLVVTYVVNKADLATGEIALHSTNGINHRLHTILAQSKAKKVKKAE